MRRGVCLFVLGVLAAALAATSARADGTTGATTTTTATPAYARLTPSFLSLACVGAGDAAIVEPGSRVLALGTPAATRGPSAYPLTAPVVAFGSAAASGSTCKTAHVTLESVSLFGGLVTATSVEATHGSGTVNGLEVGGSPVTLAAGQTALLGDWGEVTSGRRVGRLTAPLAVVLFARHGALPAGTTILVGFAAAPQPAARAPKHQNSSSKPSGSTRPTDTTPSTTTRTQTQPAHSTKTKAKAKKRRHHKRHAPQPLTARPSLGYKPGHYVFPVNGGASYVDTYGGVRNDVYDGWHHGDDLFANLGTPVVAVATGKLSLVGWNRLGGWRLWLTDGKGNSFYYAHLAGYSRWILDHPNVKAGQVVGFLGRTGDAFTTEPHLHFEIHPQLYLKLGYDGAVDPTTYLQKWHTVWVPKNEMPQPAKLKAPVGAPAQEAAVVWHELLTARHLLGTQETRPPVTSGPERPFPQLRILGAAGPSRLSGLSRTAASVPAADMTVWWGGGTGGAVAIVALSAGGFFVRRRRRTSATQTSS
jgi:murein DD-endopeptidase MepM/ murein hydrolase activator NlpD